MEISQEDNYKKYIFITVLHFLQLENKHTKGKELRKGMRIANSNHQVKKLLESNLFNGTVGFHSIDEFNNAVYVYVTGDLTQLRLNNLKKHKDFDFTFYFLREVQAFVNDLWLIKDNSVYVRDGFLTLYDDDIEKGITYKASLSAVNSTSQSEVKPIIFTNTELELTIKEFQQSPFPSIDEFNQGGKHPEPGYYKKDSSRESRADYFIKGARGGSNLASKIVSYCTALECLFTTGNSEVNHKIAERVAVLLSNNPESRKEHFSIVKKAYDIRSRIIHGSYIKEKDEMLIHLSEQLDTILRQILSSRSDVFSLSDFDMDEYFINKIMGLEK